MHETFMRSAIALALDSVTSGAGGPFGALVVRADTIVSQGTNLVTQTNDPTAHAEIVAIRRACASLETFHLDGCTIYASCEPCPMCLAAIYWARLDRIYYAGTRTAAAAAGFDDEFLYLEIPRPHAERRVPLMQLLEAEAHVPFDAWKSTSTKILY